jgi:hypothetical protein
MSWLRSPGRMAWVGGVAMVVVGAGVVLLTTRLERPDLRDFEARQAPGAKTAPRESTLEDRDAVFGETDQTPSSEDASRVRALESGSPAAPRPVGVEERGELLQKGGSDFARPPASIGKLESKVGLESNEASPIPEAKEGASRGDAAGRAAPQRLTESRRTAAGEDVPVVRQGAPAAPAPAPAARAPASKQAEIVKPPATPAGKAGISALAREQERASADLNLAVPEEATVSLCGRVVDPNGRAVNRARVTLVESGRSVSTDAQGRFCIDAAPGDHALSVMAVGFDETRLTARAGSGLPAVAVTLGAVSVLDPSRSLAGARDNAKRTLGFVSREPSDVFSALPDSLRARVREAQAVVADGRARRSAARLEQGAERWERVVGRMSSEVMEAEARFRLAEARYLAWRHDPSATTQDRTGAPSLVRRNAALAAVRRALESPGSRVQSQTLRTWLRELAP